MSGERQPELESREDWFRRATHGGSRPRGLSADGYVAGFTPGPIVEVSQPTDTIDLLLPLLEELDKMPM